MSELKINQLSPLSGGSITTTAPISCSVMPTTADQLANKMYVDSLFRQSGAGVSKDYVDNQDIRYYNQVGENFVRKSGNVNEVVTGTKAFTTPPTCNTMCGVENELANKQYVDERSLQTYVDAQNYANSLLSGQGAPTPITAIDLPQMTWVDGSGQSQTGYSMAGSSDARPEIIGANGIVVSGQTGEYPPATGQSGPQRFNRIVIDGSGLGGDYTYVAPTGATAITVDPTNMKVGGTKNVLIATDGSGGATKSLTVTCDSTTAVFSLIVKHYHTSPSSPSVGNSYHVIQNAPQVNFGSGGNDLVMDLGWYSKPSHTFSVAGGGYPKAYAVFITRLK